MYASAMKLFGTSAFAFWRLAACAAAVLAEPSSSRRYPRELCAAASSVFQSAAPSPSCDDACALPSDRASLLEKCVAADGLVHVEVDDAAARHGARKGASSCFAHVRSNQMHSARWLPAAFGLKVPTPELCFLQLATQLSLPHLAMVGMELCGTYAVSPDEDGALVHRRALTTCSALRSLVEKSPSSYGVKKARRALSFIADGAASPQEARLHLLLSLPVRLGGYGLPPAQLNYRIETNASGGIDPAKRYRLCDLYWPDRQVAVEYDSDAFHIGAEKIASDSIRRAALSTRGISVVTVTGAQLRSPMMTDQLVAALCRKLGVRKRACAKDWSQQRESLRESLFEDCI